MTNKWCYELKLYPTSPMIVFQKNGMLRATEVKPKLDKFILSRINAESHKDWITNKGSLNYKMSISSYKDKEEFVWMEKVNNRNTYYFEIFFGEKKEENRKYLYLLYPKIQIVCFIPELL